jgi:lipid-A-disaccharide synthase
MIKRIFITAGESSGDIYGANLMKAILKLQPKTEFIGFGGPEMQNSGLQSITDFSALSVMGFLEVAKKYAYFQKLLNLSKKLALESKIDCFIGMDYPGFNLRLEKFLKNNGIKTFHYIAPQTWAWGKNREKKFKDSIDTLLTVLPFEKEYFSKASINAEYIGHPLLELPILKNDPQDLTERQFKCAILAGSRKQELDHHIPVLKEVVKKLHIKYPDLKFATSVVNDKHREYLKELEVNGINLEFYDDSRIMMKECKFGIIKSGTSTLEAALCGLPFFTIYKTSVLTYFIAKKLVKIPSISLPNILLSFPAVREIIQNDFTSENVFKESVDIIENSERSNILFEDFKKIRKLLKCTEPPSLTAAHLVLK